MLRLKPDMCVWLLESPSSTFDVRRLWKVASANTDLNDRAGDREGGKGTEPKKELLPRLPFFSAANASKGGGHGLPPYPARWQASSVAMLLGGATVLNTGGKACFISSNEPPCTTSYR
nr:hypothetical protein B0A51_05394 [Rachicladosporium sp. CCFEE 5018]